MFNPHKNSSNYFHLNFIMVAGHYFKVIPYQKLGFDGIIISTFYFLKLNILSYGDF